MRLNRRATFCLGTTRQDIDRRIQPRGERAFAIHSTRYGGPAAGRAFFGPGDGRVRWHDRENRAPYCRPRAEECRKVRGSLPSQDPIQLGPRDVWS
jgi:hypothetical protein